MKKHSFKQILVIVVIAVIVILDILALVFALTDSEDLHKLSWIFFFLSIAIPFFIFIHLKVLDLIRKTHEVDSIKEAMSEDKTDDETT